MTQATNGEGWGHTPGPWEWSKERRSLIRDNYKAEGKFSSSTILAIRNDDAFRPDEADARLIAAAPDMLEVLLDLFERGDVHVAFAGNPAACEALEAKARAALSRALGDQQP